MCKVPRVLLPGAFAVYPVGGAAPSMPPDDPGGLTMRTILLVAGAFLLATHASAQAPDPNLARNLAATCAICHGTNGVSQGVVASLAGNAKSDTQVRMQEFKNGKRTGTIMPQIAKGFTDEQIDLIAGFFAQQSRQGK